MFCKLKDVVDFLTIIRWNPGEERQNIYRAASSETQGRLAGARGNKSGKEMKRRRFTSKAEKPLGTDTYKTISKRIYQCCVLIGQKNPLYSAQSANSSSWGTVMCSYATTFASPYLLGSNSVTWMNRAPTYRMQLGKFSFRYPDESIVTTLFMMEDR